MEVVGMVVVVVMVVMVEVVMMVVVVVVVILFCRVRSVLQAVRKTLYREAEEQIPLSYDWKTSLGKIT